MGYIWSIQIGLSRHTMLAISRRFILVLSWFDQFIKQTLCVGKVNVFFVGKFGYSTSCVSCFTKIHCLFFHVFTSRKTIHSVLANLAGWFGEILVNEKWFMWTHCVRYFTKVSLSCLIICLVGKIGTMC